jgi:hypothetical protein
MGTRLPSAGEVLIIPPAGKRAFASASRSNRVSPFTPGPPGKPGINRIERIAVSRMQSEV